MPQWGDYGSNASAVALWKATMFPRDTAIQAYPNATSVIRRESDENLRCRLGGIDVS